MNKNVENFDNIIDELFDEQNSHQIRQNLRFTENLLNSNPAPAPSDRLINAIKKDIYRQNAKRKLNYIPHTAAAALLLIISITASMFFLNKNQPGFNPALSESQWKSTDFTLDDPELLEIQTAINDISYQLNNLDQNGYSDLSDDIYKLETELIDLDENFWKG